MNQRSFDAIVVGGGPAGLAAALALSRGGKGVALVDPVPTSRPPTGRTTAVMRPQAEILERLGAWPADAGKAPLRGLRIINRTPGGPETDVLFTADELDIDCFGWNVRNSDLVDALHAAAADRVELVAARLEGLRRSEGRWRLELDDGGRLSASLVAGADGKNSRVRDALRIGVRRHDYGQTANAAHLRIDGHHDNVSVEVHKSGGPFTTVPAGPRQVSLVWLERDARAQQLAALDNRAFLEEVEHADERRHGRFTAVEGRACVPIVGLLAHRLTAPGALILGEAAHAVSPLGAQGFNLTLRDCAALESVALSAPFARADVLKAYERARLGETRLYFWFIDMLNRAVFRADPAVGLARGLGLQAMHALAPVRRDLMQRLMQPQPLFGAA